MFARELEQTKQPDRFSRCGAQPRAVAAIGSMAKRPGAFSINPERSAAESKDLSLFFQIGRGAQNSQRPSAARLRRFAQDLRI